MFTLVGDAVLPDGLQYPFDFYYTGLLGNIIMFGIARGLSFAFLTRKELPGLTVWSQ